MEGQSSQTSSAQSLDVNVSADSSQSSDSGVFEDKSPANRGNVETAAVSRWEERAMAEFNKNRKIIVRNVPPVTYEEIKNFLHGYSVSNISISKKCRHAIVTLVNGEEAEEIVQRLNHTSLLNMPVQVSVHPSDNLLCLAHLPLNMDENEFRKFAEPYGALEKCFLMHNEFGQSKGYGFIEYVHNKEKSSQVRDLLNRQKLGSCAIHCDFVPEEVLLYGELHSRRLLVDHLPPGYLHQGEFSAVFSQLAKPQYCQLLEKNGEPLSCGVLEYGTAGEAERVQKATHGMRTSGHMIRVTFCAPGYSPSQVCERITAITEQKSGSLLPSPEAPGQPIPSLLSLPLGPSPLPPGLSQGGYPGSGGSLGSEGTSGRGGSPPITNPLMRNLLASNPQVLDKFQHVLRQLQSQVWQQNTPTSGKPGLLGMAPQVNPLTNPDLQISILAVLLASQLQQNSSHSVDLSSLLQTSGDHQSSPSLLGNPLMAQAQALIQSLVSGPGQKTLSPHYSQQASPSSISPASSDGGQQRAGVPALLTTPPLRPNGDISQSDFQRLLSVLQGGNRGFPKGYPPGNSQGNPHRPPGMVLQQGGETKYQQRNPQGFPGPHTASQHQGNPQPQGNPQGYPTGNPQGYPPGKQQFFPRPPGASLLGDVPGSQVTRPPPQMPVSSQLTGPPTQMPPPVTQPSTKSGLLGTAPHGLHDNRSTASNHGNQSAAQPGNNNQRQTPSSIPSLLSLPLEGSLAPPPGSGMNQHLVNRLQQQAFNNRLIPEPRDGMLPPRQTGSSNNRMGNPLLALMIESQIKQQLQALQRGVAPHPLGPNMVPLPRGLHQGPPSVSSQQTRALLPGSQQAGPSLLGQAPPSLGQAPPSLGQAPPSLGQGPQRAQSHPVSLRSQTGLGWASPVTAQTSQPSQGALYRPHAVRRPNLTGQTGPAQQSTRALGAPQKAPGCIGRPLLTSQTHPNSSSAQTTGPMDQENIPTTTLKPQTSTNGRGGTTLSDSGNSLKRSISEISECDTPHTNSLSTPVAKKIRPLHWVPSPEPSPENDYIGQHSQGLGGHYAASYSKKWKLH